MSTTQQKIDNWAKHRYAGFSRNFCPPRGNGLSRLASLEMTSEDFGKLKEFGKADSYELLMGLDKSITNPADQEYNFVPVLRVTLGEGEGKKELDLDFSQGQDVQHNIDRLKLELKPDENSNNDFLRIPARLTIQVIRIMESLLKQGNNFVGRQLILQELKRYMDELDDVIEERIVPGMFRKAVGAIWWLISDHDIFELMFEERNTLKSRLISFLAKENPKRNQRLYRALSIVSSGNPDVKNMRVYPSIIPEKYNNTNEEAIKIPFSFVFEIEFSNNYLKHQEFIDSAKEGADQGGEGIVLIEYIQPCPECD